MDSSLTKIVKAYETKILDLTKELDQAKLHTDKIRAEHLKVAEAFEKSNRNLQHKIAQLRDAQNQNAELETKVEEVEGKLKETLIKYSLLQETMISGPTKSRQIRIKNKEFLQEITDIKEENMKVTLSEFSQRIQEENQKNIQYAKQISSLKQNLLKSTVEYQTKISTLTVENKRLSGIIEHQKAALCQVDLLESTESYVLVTENLTLEEKLKISLQKVSAFEKEKLALEREIEELKQIGKNGVGLIESHPQSKHIPSINQVIESELENIRLKHELEELQTKYNILTIEFPEYTRALKKITEIIELNRRINELQIQNEHHQVVSAQSEKYVRCLEQEKKDVEERNEVLENRVNNDRKFYNSIYEKFIAYLNENNHQFKRFGLETILLSEDQLQHLENNTTPEVLKFDASERERWLNSRESQMEAEKCKNDLQAAKTEAERHGKTITELKDKILGQESLIQKLNTDLSVVRSQICSPDPSNQSQFFTVLQKVQAERNQYYLACKQKDGKIIELMTSVSQLKEESEKGSEISAYHISKQAENPIHNIYQYAQAEQLYNLKLSALRNNFEQQRRDWETLFAEKDEKFGEELQQVKLLLRKKECEVEQVRMRESQNVQKVNEFSNRILNKDRPFSEMGSIPEIDENIMVDESEAPMNSVNNQSIDSLNKVLSGHEVILKNLLNSYQHLEAKYLLLLRSRESVELPSDIAAENTGKELEELREEHKMMSYRLKESDTNNIVLEMKLEESQEENEKIRENLRAENELLKKMMGGLKEEINWLKSDEKNGEGLQASCVGGLNEEVSYLFKALEEKKSEVQSLKKELSEANKKIAKELVEDNQDFSFRSLELQQLSDIVRSGVLGEVLDGAIQRLKAGNQQSI